MEVLLHSQAKFESSLADLRRRGGEAARAADHVDSIIGKAVRSAAAAVAEFGRLTKKGESRIPGCVKFDLVGAHRLVCVQQDNALWLLFVGNHEDADRWIDRNKGLRVVVDKVTRRMTVTWTVPPEAPLPRGIPKKVVDADQPLLEKLPDDALDGLELRAAQLRKLQKLTVTSGDDDLLDAIDAFEREEDRRLVLSVLLALRDREVENATALIRAARGQARPLDEVPEELQAALAAPVNADQVVSLREFSEVEFKHLFHNADFQEWMLYLHPDQKSVARDEYGPVTQLRGVSGSGKTCVLVHRAKTLAERYAGERVLVLALNPALAVLIGQLLDALCPAEVRARITCIPMAVLYRRILAQFEPGRVVQEEDPRSGEDLEDCWKDSFERDEQQHALRPMIESLVNTHKLDAGRYLRDEFTWVRSAFAAEKRKQGQSGLPLRHTFTDPEQAKRRGRAIPFSRDWRERTLQGLRHYEDWLEAGGFCDAAALALAAHSHVDALKAGPPEPLRFRALLVDEVQDLGTVELDIVRALAPVAGDGLFLTGDDRQQVFPKDHDLRAAGIEVTKRRFFRKNYRNTKQILEAGVELVRRFGSGQGDDELEVLDPEYSARDSARPLVVKQADEAREIAWVVDYVRSKRAVDQNPVCIVACGLREDEAEGLATLARRYRNAGLDVALLLQDSKVRPGAVFVSALETVKGFEFSLVLITRCTAGRMPVPGLPAGEEWRDARRMYVAMTRARDELVFTFQGKASKYIEAIREHLTWQDE